VLEAIQSIDSAILLFFQTHIRCALLTPIMKAASFLGDDGMIWIAVTVVLLLLPRTRRGGLDVLLSLSMTIVLNNLVLKNLIARPRPYWVLPELELIVKPLSSYSFPSGHSFSGFAAATAITLAFGKKLGIPAYILAALIALSRIYVGIHFPSDVLAGAVLGVLVALLVCALTKRFIHSDLRFKREEN